MTLLPSFCCATSQSRSPWAWASASSCRRPTATGSRTPRQLSSDKERQSPSRRVAAHGLGFPTGRQEDRAAVEIEAPRRLWAEAVGFQHADQRAGRVVREVPVPEGIPLAQPDDRLQRVVLKQEDAPRGDPGHPLGQGRGLIRVVHHPERVNDQVSVLTLGDGR